MIIVVATMHVAPEDRDRYLDSKRGQVTATRDETGCLEYAYAADADDPGKVRLLEQWESMADLEAHLAALRSAPPSSTPNVEVRSTKAELYDATPVTPPWT